MKLTPSFLLKGICSAQIVGNGSITIIKSRAMLMLTEAYSSCWIGLQCPSVGFHDAASGLHWVMKIAINAMA